MHRLARGALLVCAGGVALHTGTAAFRTDWQAGPTTAAIAFVAGLWLWSCLPYALWAGVALWRRPPALALGGALAALAADLFMHHSVFIAPAGSTAALGLLFMPLWNLVLVGPIGAALGWGVARLIDPGEANAG